MSDTTEDIPTIQEEVAVDTAAAAPASTSSHTTVPVTPVYVFNQYYWDFIKKVKDYAKQKRDSDVNAKHILKTIKQHYAMFDKLSEEHRQLFLNQIYNTSETVPISTWTAYQTAPLESLLTFFESEPYSGAILFKGDITLGQIHRLIQTIPTAEKFLLHQYLTLFGILSHPEADPHTLLVLMKQFKLNDELKEKLSALPDESSLKTPLVRLYEVFVQITAKAPSNPLLDEIEQTSLGKLAKEIMNDINLDDLQPDLLSGGGLMDLLTKGLSPSAMAGTDTVGGDGGSGAGSGGLAKIISSVSQKMISKMSSGEIQQEELLKDALNVASKLPSMLPGGIGGDLSKMGDMLSMLSGMAGGGGGRPSSSKSSKSKKHRDSEDNSGFDLSALMSMMGGMNFGGKTVSKKQMNKPGREGIVKTKMSSEMKRQKMAEKLRKQLDERNKKTTTD